MKRGSGLILTACCLALFAGCATPRVEPADEEIVRCSEDAKAAYAAGLPSKAAALYARALERGKLVDAPREVARNAYNLGLCRMATGDLAGARRLFHEARVLLEPDAPELGMVLAAGAEAALREGDGTAARAMAARVPGLTRDRAARCQASLVQAELDVREGRLKEAKRAYETACRGGDKGLPPLLQARREALAARLMAEGVLAGDEAGALLRQAEYLRKAGQYREMAAALVAAGDALRDAGRNGESFGCYERAARSLDASGDRVAARAMLVRMACVAETLDKARFGERLEMAVKMVEAQGRDNHE